MKNVTLSTKFQVVIPKEVRMASGLRAGTKFTVIPYKDRIELIPLRPIVKLRGVLKGIDTRIVREKDRI